MGSRTTTAPSFQRCPHYKDIWLFTSCLQSIYIIRGLIQIAVTALYAPDSFVGGGTTNLPLPGENISCMPLDQPPRGKCHTCLNHSSRNHLERSSALPQGVQHDCECRQERPCDTDYHPYRKAGDTVDRLGKKEGQRDEYHQYQSLQTNDIND